MNRSVFAGVVLVVLGIGCKPATDLNTPCTLVKRNPDGGTPLTILESEVRNVSGTNKDFISIGSLDCEDLICVRDSNYLTDGGMDGSTPFVDGPAAGYCSRRCVQGSLCPSADEALDKSRDALHCRALLLSQETLAALEATDGGFTGVRDPYFCARGATDGG